MKLIKIQETKRANNTHDVCISIESGVPIHCTYTQGDWAYYYCDIFIAWNFTEMEWVRGEKDKMEQTKQQKQNKTEQKNWHR